MGLSAKGAEMNHNKAEIVLVEDNADDAELIARALRKHHFADGLVVLKDGAEALDFFFTQGAADGAGGVRPKAIFLDWKLPKVNGNEVLQRIKSDERTKNIPVVVLTSSREERDLQAAYAMGANSYVTKPIHFEEFAQTVADLGRYWLTLNKACE